MRGKLYFYMRSIITRFPKLQELYQRIKKRPGLRNSTNDSIRSTYARIQKDRDMAKEFNKAKSGAKINKLWLGCGKKSDTIISVNYHFRYDFGRKSSSGRSGRSDVHDTIDVPMGSTKGEINAIVRERIREWMMANYEHKYTGSGSLPFTVDYLGAC